MFSYDLGGGSAEIRGKSRIDDGQVHRIKLDRIGRRGSIQVDQGDVAKGKSKVCATPAGEHKTN